MFLIININNNKSLKILYDSSAFILDQTLLLFIIFYFGFYELDFKFSDDFVAVLGDSFKILLGFLRTIRYIFLKGNFPGRTGLIYYIVVVGYFSQINGSFKKIKEGDEHDEMNKKMNKKRKKKRAKIFCFFLLFFVPPRPQNQWPSG